MSDAPQPRTDSFIPPTNGRPAEVEALTTALTEARWRQSWLESIIAQVPVGVFVADAKTGLPQLVNQTAVDLLGRGLDPHRRKDASAEVFPNYVPGTQQLYPVQDLPLVRTMALGEAAQVLYAASRRSADSISFFRSANAAFSAKSRAAWLSRASRTT